MKKELINQAKVFLRQYCLMNDKIYDEIMYDLDNSSFKNVKIDKKVPNSFTIEFRRKSYSDLVSPEVYDYPCLCKLTIYTDGFTYHKQVNSFLVNNKKLEYNLRCVQNKGKTSFYEESIIDDKKSNSWDIPYHDITAVNESSEYDENSQLNKKNNSVQLRCFSSKALENIISNRFAGLSQVKNSFALNLLNRLGYSYYNANGMCRYSELWPIDDNGVLLLDKGECVNYGTSFDDIYGNFNQMYVGINKYDDNSKIDIGQMYYNHIDEHTSTLPENYFNGELPLEDVIDYANKIYQDLEKHKVKTR